MPGQKRSRLNRKEGLDRKPTAQDREAIRVAAHARSEQLDALAKEYIPRLRELHQEYVTKRRAVYDAYEQTRLAILELIETAAA